MVGFWVIIGLIVSAICVSVLGATFSIVGLGALFSGAMLAVWAMAGALEFSKFVLAAYLHQRWKSLNFFFKYYLVFSVVVLSLITSMGIFGFLSDAYQSSAHEIEEINIKISNLRSQQKLNQAEIARINKSIDEIPENRVTKKINARAEAEPRIAALTKASEAIDRNIGDANLQLHEIKKKLGPLVYIARAAKQDVDTVVTYLILVFVVVFDPLAICLVIATSEALVARRRAKSGLSEDDYERSQSSYAQPIHSEVFRESSSAQAVPNMNPESVAPLRPDFATAEDEILEMKYVDTKKTS